MLENYKNSKIHIAVGPCIDTDSYEVGLEFKDKFIKEDKTFEKFFNNKETNKIHFDLREFVNSKFKKFQRNIESIENVKHDTFKDAKNFFSYRRSTKIGENDYGRCISVIALI
jgi:copper oxidase (laccase) domain-containing protein